MSHIFVGTGRHDIIKDETVGSFLKYGQKLTRDLKQASPKGSNIYWVRSYARNSPGGVFIHSVGA